MDGYMIDVQYDTETLRVHAKNKAARFALTGAETKIVTSDDNTTSLQTRLGDNDIEIPRSTIATATFKGASMMTNGNLVVVTTEGTKYQLHFRKKQQAGFETLAKELGAIPA